MKNTGEYDAFRGWEYARQGDYHRNLDLNWSYAPTYLAKMRYVRKWVTKLPVNVEILDAGCGEGVPVDEFSALGRSIVGLDLNYESPRVRRGDVRQLPFPDGTFGAMLLLDVFEHLAFPDQPNVLSEALRVLKPGGWLLASIPNLAHLNSRFRFVVRGSLDRTDDIREHPGERPWRENLSLLERSGFDVVRVRGVTLSVPFVYRRLICRHAVKLRWLHELLDYAAVPGLSMLNLFYCRKPAT